MMADGVEGESLGLVLTQLRAGFKDIIMLLLAVLQGG